ncbi:MAG: preprotein translocase subunit SecG [Desulfobulbaceae bacterium]|nr:preprotein translocase subunit SecG [Desulfobulbaceae bacterium]
MTTLLIITHVLVCLFLIGIVLLQHGKGADIGATFGGSSQSLFGTEGPVPLLNKITTLAAIVFMGTSVSLAYISANKSTGTVMGDLKVPQAPVQQQAPADMEPVTVPMPATEDAMAPADMEPVTVPMPETEAVQPAATQVMPVEQEQKQ